MQQRVEREADQRSWPTRDQITECRVRSSDATVASDDRHAHGAQLEAHAQLVLALDERLLRGVAIGDVTSDRESCPPPFELDRLRRHLDPQLRAALGAMEPLPRQRRPRPGATEPREQHRHIGRVEKVGDAHRAELGLRPSVLRDRLVVHCEERERVEVVDPHRIGRRLEELAVAAERREQLDLGRGETRHVPPEHEVQQAARDDDEHREPGERAPVDAVGPDDREVQGGKSEGRTEGVQEREARGPKPVSSRRLARHPITGLGGRLLQDARRHALGRNATPG